MILGKRSKDISNQRFGALVAIRPSHKGNRGTVYWEFLCNCGKPHIARGNVIAYEAKKNKPNLPSCGCVELTNKTKHGFRKSKDTHPAYRAYRSMMSRCYDTGCPGYKWYGAIGVSVSAEWKGNPKAFIDWAVHNGWKPNLHIDKDILCKEKGISPHVYSPSTCQWVTARINVGFSTNRDNYGKHPNVKLSHQDVIDIVDRYTSGAETNMSQLARDYNVNPSSIRKILLKAKSEEEK